MALPNNTTDRIFQAYRSGDNPGETKIGVTIESDTSGSATEAKQDDQIVLLQSILDKETEISIDADAINLNTDGLEGLVGSTNTKLDTVNTNLVSIDAGIPAALGQTTMAASMPVVIASDQVTFPINFNEPVTYSSSASGFVAPAAATDIFSISGSGTKTVKIHTVRISATTTSGSPIKVNFQLIKRSTANTGGTSVTDTIVPYDSSDAAATAVFRHYTANPATLGTSVGTVRAETCGVEQNGVKNGLIEWVFNESSYKPVILRGVSQFLTVNLGGATITGSIVSISVEWSEV